MWGIGGGEFGAGERGYECVRGAGGIHVYHHMVFHTQVYADGGERGEGVKEKKEGPRRSGVGRRWTRSCGGV